MYEATSTIAAVPISCEALSTDSSTALPTPLRFPPRHTQVERSSDSVLSTGLTDNVSDFLEAPVFPVLPSDATSASLTNGAPMRTHVCGVTAELVPLSLEDIRDAQSADDNFEPVIQALRDRVKPPQGDLRDYPEEVHILFAQWDSLVLEDNVLYRPYHYSSMQIAGLRTRGTGTCGTGTAGLGHALQGQRDWDMRNWDSGTGTCGTGTGVTGTF